MKLSKLALSGMMLAFSLGGAISAAAEPAMVFKTDNLTVRLFNRPCESEKVKPVLDYHVPGEYHAQFRAGTALFQGRPLALCWMPLAGDVVVVDEDGDLGVLPQSVFELDPGA